MLTKNAAYSALLNTINMCIYDGDLSLAKEYMKLVRKQKGLYRNYSHRLDLSYFEGLLDFLLTDDPDSYNKVLVFINMVESIGEMEKAQLMREELKALTQSKFEIFKAGKACFPAGLIKEG